MSTAAPAAAAVSKSAFGPGLRTRHRTRLLVIAAAALLVAWEVAAQVVAASTARPGAVLPTIEATVRAFPELSNYWQGGLGAPAPQDGGAQTVRAALLALADGTLVTGARLAAGMALALVVGLGVGLLLGYVRTVRRFAFAPLNFLGVLPLLAMLPLFAFWFGATTKAAILFIGFGAGITVLRTTLNAVENVPAIYVDNARTLGASRTIVYRTVIVPAILPELRGGITVALTFSWSLALGAELVGIQDGLGRMMILALRFDQVARMVIIAAVFVALAASTVILFNRLADRAIRWAA
jgi:ABC-type nitrate/sulfonate/bicarbonate transport system permease component